MTMDNFNECIGMYNLYTSVSSKNQTPKKFIDSGGIRTHAISDWCLKPAP